MHMQLCFALARLILVDSAVVGIGYIKFDCFVHYARGSSAICLDCISVVSGMKMNPSQSRIHLNMHTETILPLGRGGLSL